MKGLAIISSMTRANDRTQLDESQLYPHLYPSHTCLLPFIHEHRRKPLTSQSPKSHPSNAVDTRKIFFQRNSHHRDLPAPVPRTQNRNSSETYSQQRSTCPPLPHYQKYEYEYCSPYSTHLFLPPRAKVRQRWGWGFLSWSGRSFCCCCCCC